MFALTIFIGIYSYLIFFLGLFGLLTNDAITFVTTIWLLVLFYFEKKNIIAFFNWITTNKFSLKQIKQNKLLTVLTASIILQAIVNLIGVLGPELAFDALWYHLTLPKLYLQQHSVFHIPGGLLYYSDMPKLGEMLYTGALAIGNEITVKFLHFLFGILICTAIYKVSRKFFSPLISLLAVVIFYSNIVVAWESTTAYIDLIRTFFEVMALWGFVNWYQTKKKKWLFISALLIGFAITTKLLSIGTGLIFTLFIIYRYFKEKDWTSLSVNVVTYWFIALLIPLPWFIFSFIHTGNPVFPFFTHIYEVAPEPVSLIGFFKEVWKLFTHASDPISPIYLMTLPLVFVVWKQLKKEIQYLILFSGLALIVWYFTPRTGGGRFILPYLPLFSIIIAAIYSKILSRFLMIMVVFIALVSIVYRSAAEMKYLPVILHKESKQTFLTNHLNFSFGDFYDSDNYFAKNIKPNDRVLLYGFHNLYYVDFPFVDNSWVKRGDTFNYIAVQNSKIPERFKNWQLVYKNDKTLVQLYRPPKGVCQKICVY